MQQDTHTAGPILPHVRYTASTPSHALRPTELLLLASRVYSRQTLRRTMTPSIHVGDPNLLPAALSRLGKHNASGCLTCPLPRPHPSSLTPILPTYLSQLWTSAPRSGSSRATRPVDQVACLLSSSNTCMGRTTVWLVTFSSILQNMAFHVHGIWCR